MNTKQTMYFTRVVSDAHDAWLGARSKLSRYDGFDDEVQLELERAEADAWGRYDALREAKRALEDDEINLLAT